MPVIMPVAAPEDKYQQGCYIPLVKKCSTRYPLGGRAQGMRPQDFNRVQLRTGTKHELEHTKNRCLAARIAMDHLAEDPDYYIKLRKAGL